MDLLTRFLPAIISGSFSLARQAVGLGFAPPFTIKHTSKHMRGQIYVPFLNFTLLIGTVAIVAGFGTSVNINNAYGFTVCTMMIITTCLYSILIHWYWRLPLALSGLFLVFFLFWDAMYWGAVLNKVPTGGWVALLISVLFFGILLCWWLGERALKHYAKMNYSGAPI